MKALILAAGFGTRLKPFTEKFPKPLVPVNGIPLVLYTLAFLKHSGVCEVVMNLHHLGEEIPKLLKNGAEIGMKIRYSREPKILGTGGGIKKALSLLDEDTLVVNGDVIADFDLKALIKQHKTRDDVMTMGLYAHPRAKDYGLISFEGKKLTSFLGKPEPSAKAKHAMYASFHVFSKTGLAKRFQTFPRREAFCIIRDVYIPEILGGQNFGAFGIKGFWVVCDRLKDVAGAEADLKRRRLSYAAELKKMVTVLEKKRVYHEILQARE